MMPIPSIALPSCCSRNTLLAFCTSFSLMFSPVSQALENKDFAELEQALADIKTQAALPFGTAIALVQNGQVVYQHYSGYADIQHKKAVSAETVFYIASATKPFTALAFLLLAEQKKLDMQMSLQQMWPQLHFKNINANQVTLRQLLTHQSGVDNQPLVWATAYSGEHSPASLLQLVAHNLCRMPAQKTATSATAMSVITLPVCGWITAVANPGNSSCNSLFSTRCK